MGTRVLLRALAVAFGLILTAAAEPTDRDVKAAFLPRFARYVTWPPESMPRGGAPFVLCIVGGDPFGRSLDDAAGSQLIDGRRVVVRRIASAAAADSCHIAFLANGQNLASMPARPVLTVTDAATTSQRGIIHFVVSGGRVRFFIDESAANRRGLSISSRLLALAIGVRQ